MKKIFIILGSVAGLIIIILILVTLFDIFTDRPVIIEVSHTSASTVPAAVQPSVTPSPAPATVTTTPTSTPEPKRLTICLGAQPDTLWFYGSQMLVKSTVLEAIYDGPIDSLGFEYHPVILERLPSLAEGDAWIEPVFVGEGDRVVNDAREPVQLTAGEKVRPFGCNRPDCAIEWDGSDLQMAQLSAEFTLVEGIKWSDGTPLTAADSVFSYATARSCELRWGYCGYLGVTPPRYRNEPTQRTRSYDAFDDRTVRWVGLPGWLDPNYQTNFFIPLPEHQLGELSIEELFDAEISAIKPMGWGPYIITNWVVDDHIRLRKNPHYYRAAEGLPRYDELIFRFVGEELENNLPRIFEGDCDLLDQEASMYFDVYNVGDLLIMQADGKIAVHFSTGAVWEHLDFNLLHADYDDGYQIGSDRPELFGDVRTRQAIAMCLDRERIVDEVFFSQSEVPVTYYPHDHPLFNPQAATYSFDIEKANELLHEVGWIDEDSDPNTPRLAQGVENVSDGTPFTFKYWTMTSDLRQETSKILLDSLSLCGLEPIPEYFPPAEFLADAPEGNLFSRRFDMAQFAWTANDRTLCELFTTNNITGDPDARNPDGSLRFPLGWQGKNNSGYSNPEFDRACQLAVESLPDQPAHIANQLSAQEIFTRDLPVIPLFLRIKHTITRPDFCGHRMDPTALSDTWNLEEYGYGEDCNE